MKSGRAAIYRLLACLGGFLLVFMGNQAFCATVYQPGFRTIGMWISEPEMRMDLNLWYPASRQPRELNYTPWTISASLNARPAEGKFPLLVLSHATAGTRFSYHDLAAFFAEGGYIVAAPTHAHDSMLNMDDFLSWRQLENRAWEIEATIRQVLSEKEMAAVIDRERIGFIGFGAGATVGLLLGGAIPNCDSWQAFCQHAGSGDAYCNAWAKEKLNAICQNFPVRKSLADPRIKAIAAIGPGFGMLFDRKSFQYFYPPLLLVATGADAFNPPALHCEPIARLLGNKAKYLDLPNADAGSLMSPCPPHLEAELPELCLSVSREERAELYKRLSGALLAFFDHYLGNPQNIIPIPDPPDLTPHPSPVQEPPVKKSGKPGAKS